MAALTMPVLLTGMKYAVDVVRRGPQEFWLQLGNSSVNVVCRKLNDGGLLIQVGSSIVSAYASFSMMH